MKRLFERPAMPRSCPPYLVRTPRRSVLGILAFMILVGVIALHLVVPLDGEGTYLVSENYYVEWAGTFGLIIAPPAAVVLAFLHWLATGRAFLSLVTVSLGSFLTAITAVAIAMGYLH